MGRRVRKQTWTYDSGQEEWTATTDRRFVYDGWNVVLVIDANGSPVKKMTWGLDLSGLRGTPGMSGIHDAGGVGGLLAVEQVTGGAAGEYLFLYDANGNVGQVIKTSDQSIAARYEYDPYGNEIVATGDYGANFFRFSTKWRDNLPVTDDALYYYGYRYYAPRLGRWLNRDPIGEEGGLNLCAMTYNGPTIRVDALGKSSGSIPNPPGGFPELPPWEGVHPSPVSFGQWLKRAAKSGGFFALCRCAGCAAAMVEHSVTCDIYLDDENWAECLCMQLDSSKATQWLCKSCAFFLGNPVQAAKDYIGCAAYGYP
jgi:RHS repeat-associated protein